MLSGALLLGGCQVAPVPTSVQAVADLAVTAARNLDVTAGARLLCTPPTQAQYDSLSDDYLDPVSRALGGRKPDVSYAISDVTDNGGAGSFVVTVSTAEAALAGSKARLTVHVESAAGRSCIDLGATLNNNPGDYADFRVQR
jgi:hypothetical protein